jgi:LDH2 family malate/lactate/ureidoglycolate dehydrogenase
MPAKQETLIEIDTRQVEQVGARALTAIGMPAEHIGDVMAVLMYAQNRESSQGLIKIVERTVLPRPDAGPIRVTQSVPGIRQMDGNGQPGMVVMTRASDVVAEAAAATGIAMATTHGTASSSGAIGYYASRIADTGLIGLVLAGSPPTTAVHGGVDPVMGTNPVAVAMPGSKRQFVFDMATAATTVFSLIAARDSHETVDPDLAWSPAGNPTTDPGEALRGAIRTFGGPKGSGLALVFELLTRALTGAALPGDGEDNRGNFLLAIDPAGTVGREAFAQRVDTVLEAVLASRPADANAPVRLPGGKAAARADETRRTGRTRINPQVWDRLRKLAGDASTD